MYYFDREEFYFQLDKAYDSRDMEAVEQFLMDVLEKVSQEKTEAFFSCDPDTAPVRAGGEDRGCLKNKVTVQNELLSLYRRIGRFDECLAVSAVMKEEMQELNLTDSESYAILLINEGTAYRMMQDWDNAIEDFDACEAILEKISWSNPYTRASLLNNRAPVLLQRGKDTGRREDIEKALADLQNALATLQALGGRRIEEAVTLCGIAEVSSLLGDNAAGEKAADEAVHLFAQAGRDSHEGAALSAKAGYLYKKKEYAEAARLYREAAENIRYFYGENSDYRICMENALQAEKAAAAVSVAD